MSLNELLVPLGRPLSPVFGDTRTATLEVSSTATVATLGVTGTTTTSQLAVTAGATNGFVLTCGATGGLATWQSVGGSTLQTFSTTATGIWAAPQAMTIRGTKVGRSVSLAIPEVIVEATTASAISFSITPPDLSWMPSATYQGSVYAPLFILDNAVSAFGLVNFIQSSNTIAFNVKHADNSNFGGTGGSGMFNGSLSWVTDT